jgi:excisionase family DNA binding protein
MQRPEPGATAGHDPESLWNANDVAGYLKVSRSWVYHRCEAGDLPCLRLGALVRFEPERIREYARGHGPAAATVVALRRR